MATSRHCPACSTTLLDDAPDGLCSACRAAEVFTRLPSDTDPNRTAPHPGPALAPELAHLVPLFPQLEILGLLGRGGMGTVYKARQSHLDRLVALKIVSPGTGGGEFAARFSREARTLARLSHPHIVTVYDSGQAGTLYYLLMEYVEGPNLRELVRAGTLQYQLGERVLPAFTGVRLAPDVALWFADQLCQALEYAHGQGIVHRDIKPENILVAPDGRLKLADFGLAKLLGTGTEALQLTATGHVLGTLRYMAPEQLDRPQEVDHRADIYSLAVVLYELLTGEFPVGRFPPPSELSPVDRRLDAVLLRALEKDPARRFPTITDFRSAINATRWPELAPAGVPEPGGSSPTAPIPQSTVPPSVSRPMPLAHYLVAVAGFTAAWLATCFLWDLGALGLACSAVLFVLVFVWTGRQACADNADTARRMADLPRWRCALRWVGASGLLLFGCYLVLARQPAQIDSEALQGANDLYPLNAREFEARFRGREDLLAWDMGPTYSQALQLKGLQPPPAGEWPRLGMSLRMFGQTPGSRWDGLFQFGGWLGVLVLPAAFGVLLGWRPVMRLVSLGGAAFIPYFFLLQLPIGLFNQPHFQSRIIELRQFPNRVDGVQGALQTWASGEEYNVIQTSAFDIHPQGRQWDVLGRVAIFHLRRSPITTRWKLRPGMLEQTGADLVVVCVDCDAPRLVTVQVIPICYATDRKGGPEGSQEHDAVAEAVAHYLEDHLRQPLARSP